MYSNNGLTSGSRNRTSDLAPTTAARKALRVHSERNHIVVRRRLLRPKAALLTFAVLTGVVWTLSAQSNPLEERRSKLRSLEAEEYEYELRTHPERATKYGDDRFNDRLADYSVQFFESDLKQKQRFLDRPKEIGRASWRERG